MRPALFPYLFLPCHHRECKDTRGHQLLHRMLLGEEDIISRHNGPHSFIVEVKQGKRKKLSPLHIRYHIMAIEIRSMQKGKSNSSKPRLQISTNPD